MKLVLACGVGKPASMTGDRGSLQILCLRVEETGDHRVCASRIWPDTWLVAV